MKYATALLLASVVQARQEHIENEALTDAVHIFEGIMMGALDAEFKDIEHCIQDGESIIKDAETAWTDFKGLKDVKGGLKALGDAMMKVKSALSDCKDIEADFEKLEAMAVEFSNPASVAWHIGKDLLVHGVDIYHEITTAVKDMEQSPKDYYDFGFNVGKAAAQIIIGQEPPVEELQKMNKVEVTQTLAGVMKPFGGNFNFENLLFCVYEEDQAAIILYQAVQTLEEAWEKKDFGDAIGGIIMIVAFVQQFKQGLPICEAIDTAEMDFKQFSDTIDIAAHPFEHFELLENDIKMHGKSITQDIKNAIDAYRSGEYENFGEIFGYILKLATEDKNMMSATATWKSAFPGDNRVNLAEIYQGFMEEMGVGTFNFTNLLLCIYEADQAAIMAYEGVEMAEEAWQKKEWQEGIGAAIALVGAVQSFKQQALPICEQVDSSSLDFTKINEITELGKNQELIMKTILENLLQNGVVIAEEFSNAMESLESEDYNKFGHFLASAALSATAPLEGDLFLY